MSRCERRPPVDLKIVDARLQFGPVGYGQAGKIRDHQATAVSGDELGAFFVGGEFLHHLGRAQGGHFQGQLGKGTAGSIEGQQQVDGLVVARFRRRAEENDAGRVDISCTYWAMVT